MFQKSSCCIDCRQFRTGPKPGVDAEDAPAAGWGGKEQVAEILREHPDRLLIGPLFSLQPDLHLDGRGEEPLVGVFRDALNHATEDAVPFYQPCLEPGQDFLYRVAVPGHAELNQMQTELDMTDHAIRKVQEVQFTARTLGTETCDADSEGRVFLDTNQGLYICRNGQMEILADTGNSTLLKNATLARNGDVIEEPTCPPGTNTVPEIFVAPSITAAGAEAPPLTAFQAWATSLNATQWRVNLRLLTTDDNLGWVNPAPDYARIIVCTTCAKGS